MRAECGFPPPASPVGAILPPRPSDTCWHARRWAEVDAEMRRLLLGEYGQPPAPVDPAARAAAERGAGRDRTSRRLDEAREEAGSLAASEEDLLPRRAVRRRAPCRCSSACADARADTADDARRSTTARRRACAG